MARARKFSQRMELRSDQVGQGADKMMRKAALAADQAVVLATPVDTGRARSNWLVSLGSPRRETVPAYNPGENLGKNEGANARGAINHAKSVLNRRRESNRSIYISNNLAYINRLNDGYSAQSPEGFVQSAIQQAARAIKGVKIFTR